MVGNGGNFKIKFDNLKLSQLKTNLQNNIFKFLVKTFKIKINYVINFDKIV